MFENFVIVLTKEKNKPLPICPTWHKFPFFRNQVQTRGKKLSFLVTQKKQYCKNVEEN